MTEYPPSTEETAILAHLADRNGITLRIYDRLVTAAEQRKIVQQAMRKNHMMTTVNDVNESIKAQDNINDVVVPSNNANSPDYDDIGQTNTKSNENLNNQN